MHLPVSPLRNCAPSQTTARPRSSATYVSLFAAWLLTLFSTLFAGTDLQVSSNGRYLQQTNGTPFYWMGDTGWNIFNRLNRSDVLLYLNDRQSKGVTVIQTMVHTRWCAGGSGAGPEQDNPVNYYGHLPFTGTTSDPNTSAALVVAGGTPDSPNDYWDNVDFVVRETRNRGMHLAIAPTWGAFFINGSYPEYTSTEAKTYGRFIGDRYKNEPHIIWILGGDADANVGGDKQGIYRAMAEGIAEGVSGLTGLVYNQASSAWATVLMTFHPPGDLLAQTQVWFHGDLWLDFDMMQSGQQYPDNVTPLTDYYYGSVQSPTVKPIVMGECLYEGYIHWDEIYPGNAAIDVRRSIYQSWFAGARGYTYGTASSTAAVDITTLDDVWAFGSGGTPTSGHTWKDRLPESATPGSFDLPHVNSLLSTRAWYKHVPDQSIITSGAGGNDRYQKRASRSTDGNEILVYYATNSAASIRNSMSTGANAQWFNPADGTYQSTGSFTAGQTISKQPPTGWADAVLILTGTGGGGSSLPSPWVNQDIGAVAAAGSASYSGGTFTVAGSGADIWGTGDEFQYVYQPVSGDCTIVARVASQSYSADWAKSGVMIRETTATGAKNAFMFKIPQSNQIVAQYRSATDGTTAQPSVTSGAVPYWVKLNRTGSNFTFYKSSDGSNWGSALATQTITMSNTVNIGLAVTSHADGTLCNTTFDNVTVTGGSGYTSVKDWNFNTDGNLEGWTLTRCTATVSGGAFNITATATDPLVKSPSSLGITAPATYNKIRIRMQNNSPQTSAAFSFITTADQTWGSNGKWVQFTIAANSGYTDYVLDMSAVPSWTGTIHQVRIDPLDPAVANQTVNIDYVRITN